MPGWTHGSVKVMASPPRSFSAAVIVLVVLATTAVSAPWLAPFDPNVQADTGQGPLPPLSRRTIVTLDTGQRYLAKSIRRAPHKVELLQRDGIRSIDPAEIVQLGDGDTPNQRLFLLGTDRHGRDVLSRLLFGARISFFVALVSILVIMIVGITVGALAALGGPILDTILMRMVDGLLAFPWLILLIMLASIFPGSNLTLALIIGASSWMPVSRLARAELLRVTRLDFVLAARALGASPQRIFFRHMLPHIATPLMVRATLSMAGVVIVEASLSFLGFGVSTPTASWGNMIYEGKAVVLDAWWISTFPALCLAVTVIALSLAGDGLRDVLDPRRHTA